MTLKTFLTDALASAFELGVATPDDLVRFATPELLAEHLPRPLWARLLTACLGATRVDAQLIVETVGVPNLCEHLPASVVWQCVSTVAARALGDVSSISEPIVGMRIGVSTPTAAATITAAGSGEWGRAPATAVAAPPVMPLTLAPPPAPTPVAEIRAGSRPNQTPPPSTPIPAPLPPQDVLDVIEELDDPIAPPPPVSASGRARGTTRQPFRAAATNPGRTTASASRRPQAQAAPAPSSRRAPTEINDYDVATDVRSADDFSSGDNDLVDWAGSEETVTGDESGDHRKR